MSILPIGIGEKDEPQAVKPDEKGNSGKAVYGRRTGLRSQTADETVAKEASANLPSSLQDLIDQLVPDARGTECKDDKNRTAKVEFLCPVCDVVFQDKMGWTIHVQSYHWWRVAGEGVEQQEQGVGLQSQGVGLQGQGVALQGQGEGLQGQGVALQGQGEGLQGQGEGLQGQGVALQGQGEGLQGQDIRLQGQVAGLQGQGEGLQGQGVGLQGTGLLGEKLGLQAQGVGLLSREVGLQGQGGGVQGRGAGLHGQGEGLQGQGVGLQDQGKGLHAQGLGLHSQPVGLQGQEAALQGQGVGLQGQGAELQYQGQGLQGQGPGFLQCALCPERRRTVKEAAEHAGTHRGLMHACSHCPAVLPPSQPHQVRHHLLEHCVERTRPPTYPACNLCGQETMSTSSLALHIMTVHGEVIPTRVIPQPTTHPCNYCQLSFDTEGPLLRHIIDTHAKNKNKGDSSSSSTSEEIAEPEEEEIEDVKQQEQSDIQEDGSKKSPKKKKSISVDVGGPPFKCTVCNKVCKSAPTYAAHKNHYCPGVRGQRGKKSFLCSLCGAVLTTNSGFRQHMANHTDKNKFSCDICHKTFSVLSQVNFHRKQHARPFICQTCGKRFKTLSHLNDHQITHSTEEKYACDMCDARFRWRPTLTRHKYTSHGQGEKPHNSSMRRMVCNLCNVHLTSGTRTKHFKRRHKDVVYDRKYFTLITEPPATSGKDQGSQIAPPKPAPVYAPPESNMAALQMPMAPPSGIPEQLQAPIMQQQYTLQTPNTLQAMTSSGAMMTSSGAMMTSSVAMTSTSSLPGGATAATYLPKFSGVASGSESVSFDVVGMTPLDVQDGHFQVVQDTSGMPIIIQPQWHNLQPASDSIPTQLN